MQRHGLATGDVERLQICQERRKDLFRSVLLGEADFFDAVVLLASDDTQARSFDRAIEERRSLRQLPCAEYRCFADGESKIGNGGALMKALVALEDEFGSALDEMRILLLPCGGYSTRIPQWGPRGKIFAPVPYPRISIDAIGPSGPATMLEMKLMNYVNN